MSSNTTTDLLKELEALAAWSGPPKAFWERFNRVTGQLVGATRCVLVAREHAAEAPWRKVADEASQAQAFKEHVAAFYKSLPQIAEQALGSHRWIAPLSPQAGAPQDAHLIALRLDLPGTAQHLVIAALLVDCVLSEAQEAMVQLTLASDIPRLFFHRQGQHRAQEEASIFSEVLNLIAAVHRETRFTAAALALCNEVANQFQCDRVSLGWFERGYIHVKAISRMEHIQRAMAAVQALEKVMEESYDQDQDTLWPPPEDAFSVVRDHEAYAKQHHVSHLASFPLRVGEEAVAVLTLERGDKAFDEAEIRRLRVALDLLARSLEDLRLKDRWFGARAADTVKETLKVCLSPEHTWAKLTALMITLLFAALILIRVPYRVEANFILKSDEVSIMTAPFDGYLAEAPVRPGDRVPAQTTLLKLDTDELELQEVSAAADLNRYLREEEKARAANDLAEMRVARALADQAQARLDLISYRLEQASLRAPFEGYIVEGDLRERLGAPVRQGEALMRVARIDALYVEAEASERDVHELLNKETGEIAFVTQPKLKFPIHVERLEPAAFPKQSDNVFKLRCSLVDAPHEWFRPGMSGVCKLNVGKRSLLWIATHRTVDFLRMFFWW